jgi:tetratricopeptide (TPR) repeat protein
MIVHTLLLLLLADAPAATSKNDGRLVFGTKSEEARAAALEALRLLTEMPPNAAAIHAAAQRAVDADHDFPLGHYLLGLAFRGESEKEAEEVQMQRARELAPRAPEGERRFIEISLAGEPGSVLWDDLAAAYASETLIQQRSARAHIARLGAADSDADAEVTAIHRAIERMAAAGDKNAAAAAYYGLGVAFEQRHEFAAARKEYEAAEQSGRTSWNDITLTYLLEGNRAETLKRVHAEVERVPANTGVARWNYLGHVMLEGGDPEGAMKCYERGVAAATASDMSDDDKQVWIGRSHHGKGRCLARLGKTDEAWAEVETVRKMIDAGGEAGKQYLAAWHFLAGYVKLEAGDAAAALEHLEQAGPQHDPHRTLLMAKACEKLGDKERARKHYQEVVDSKRRGPDAAAAYDEARKRLDVMSAAR